MGSEENVKFHYLEVAALSGVSYKGQKNFLFILLNNKFGTAFLLPFTNWLEIGQWKKFSHSFLFRKNFLIHFSLEKKFSACFSKEWNNVLDRDKCEGSSCMDFGMIKFKWKRKKKGNTTIHIDFKRYGQYDELFHQCRHELDRIIPKTSKRRNENLLYS